MCTLQVENSPLLQLFGLELFAFSVTGHSCDWDTASWWWSPDLQGCRTKASWLLSKWAGNYS